MRIVVDMQGAQTESRFRGIGRYTMSFIQAVCRNCGEHEVLLVLNGQFPESVSIIKRAFVNTLPQEKILVWYAPGPVKEINPNNHLFRRVAEYIREDFLKSLQPDVIHITSLFEGYVDDAVTSIGKLESQSFVSVSLYDLIPLLNPEKYLNANLQYSDYYQRKINFLKKADGFLGISEYACQEVFGNLDININQVVNISTAIGGEFRPISIDSETIDQINSKFKINGSFVLYVGGSDERKNLPRLIKAYSLLPRAFRSSMQLVFAGRMPETDVVDFESLGVSLGLEAHELRFIGYVGDDELARLYNICTFFIFPSWHEGFGMPPLEAMSCGAPVIGANTTSLPEVIGLDDGLFDPFDSEAIAAKMSEVLTDPSLREKLRTHGVKHAQNFSWDKTSQKAIAFWEKNAVQKPLKDWPEFKGVLQMNYQALIASIAQEVNCFERNDVNNSHLKSIAEMIDLNERVLTCFYGANLLPKQLCWRLEGPFDSSYSLALLNRETARALNDLDHNVILHSTEGQGDFLPNQAFLDKNNDLKILYEKSLGNSVDRCDVVSRNLYPPRVSGMSGNIKLLHHYAWEESEFPSEWVESFNENLTGITCLSAHVKKILIDNGVYLPLSVSGCGVDHWLRIKVNEQYHINARKFRFLHVSSCFPRKGVDILLNAYGAAFNDSDDVSLVIKTFPNPHNKIHEWLAQSRLQKENYPNVILIEDDLSDSELKSLYEQCDVLVAPSRAEGFGLPLAEAMLSDLAVITTAWGGQLDFCNSETAWLVDYSFAPASTHFDLFDSVWAEPDIQGLSDIMFQVYQTPFELRQKRVEAGKRLILQKFLWADVAKRLVASAYAYATKPPSRDPHIGWVSTWNAQCGIAQYSAHLVDSIGDQITIFAPKTMEILQEDGADVFRCWETGEDNLFNELNSCINDQKINVLVIQFNYGFFNLEEFGNFLNSQIDAGRVIVIMMHATLDPIHAPHKQLRFIREPLLRCHRILVHGVSDLNRLKELGLVENVSIFPHGIQDHPHPPSIKRIVDYSSKKSFILASYGFFLPQKGLLELIEAVALLRSRGIDVQLNMINAEYPTKESILLVGQAKERISILGLGHFISLTSDFLADSETFAKLSIADLIVFPYQNSSESSSAAVRTGLATGRPVAVTPIAIFDDVSPAVIKLPGISPHEIALGIEDYINAKNETTESCNTNSADRWRATHQYSHLGKRLSGILNSLSKGN